MTVTSPEKPAKTRARRAIEIAGAAVGIGVGAYAGIHVIVPAIAALIAALVLMKSRLFKSKALMAAIAFQAAHVVWMWVGTMFVTAGTVFLVEAGVYSALLLLLVWRQAKWVAVLLMAYQLFGLVINGLQFAVAPFGTLASHALAMHLVLRAGAFITMALFLREKAKENFVAVF